MMCMAFFGCSNIIFKTTDVSGHETRRRRVYAFVWLKFFLIGLLWWLCFLNLELSEMHDVKLASMCFVAFPCSSHVSCLSQSSIAFNFVMNCVRPIHASPEITLTSGKRLLEPHVACAKPKTSCDAHVTWDKLLLMANVYLSHTLLVQNQTGWN